MMQKWISMGKMMLLRTRALVKKSGFTIALGVCLVMIGGAAFVARTANKIPTPAKRQIVTVPEATVSPVAMTPNSVETLEQAQNRLDSEMLWPVSGKEILMMYSATQPQYNGTLDLWEIHEGIDIKAEPGEAVVAALTGVVSAAYMHPVLGYLVELTHENDTKTRYANLATLQAVTHGAQVQKGDAIGSVGESGQGELGQGPHLHYEAYTGGKWALGEWTVLKDPAEYAEPTS